MNISQRWHRWALLLLAAALLGGCGPPPPPAISSDEAAQEVVRELEGTVETVAADLPHVLTELDNTPQPCNAGEGAAAGEVWRYRMTINPDADTELSTVVRDVYDYWKTRHRQVKARTLNTDPGLYVVFGGGYVLELAVDDTAREVYLIGSTPCLPPAAENAQQPDER